MSVTVRDNAIGTRVRRDVDLDLVVDPQHQ